MNHEVWEDPVWFPQYLTPFHSSFPLGRALSYLPRGTSWRLSLTTTFTRVMAVRPRAWAGDRKDQNDTVETMGYSPVSLQCFSEARPAP